MKLEDKESGGEFFFFKAISFILIMIMLDKTIIRIYFHIFLYIDHVFFRLYHEID